MSKSFRYAININNHRRFTGRLIGLINDEECNAIINTKDAARKIYTAQSIDKIQLEKIPLSQKRFVIVTDDITKGLREVFISPKIEYVVHLNGRKNFHCKDDNNYYLEEI